MRVQANELMATSKWSEALPIWAKLYAQTGKSLDLWNAAVCQHHLAQAGKATPDEALALLQQYRSAPDVTGDKKAKAQRYIDEIAALKQTQAAQAAAQTAKPAEPAGASLAAQPAAPASTGGGNGMRVAAYASAGAVAVAVLAGAFFSFRAKSLEDS